MSITTSESINRRVDPNPPVLGGSSITPDDRLAQAELYTVAAGSYAANAIHTPAAAAVSTYALPQVLLNSARITSTGNAIEVDLIVTLDLSQADPAFTGTDELRMRLSPSTSTQLPPPDQRRATPLIQLESRDESDAAVLGAAVTDRQFGMVLRNGVIAIIRRSMAVAPPTDAALTVAQLDTDTGGWGQAAGNIVKLEVKGVYVGQ